MKAFPPARPDMDDDFTVIQDTRVGAEQCQRGIYHKAVSEAWCDFIRGASFVPLLITRLAASVPSLPPLLNPTIAF